MKNAWTPIAAVSLVAFAVAVGCGGSAPPPAAPPAVVACNNQPNMSSALNYLRDARGSLERAEHNKGGWRDLAITSTDIAIRETERGCQFADTH
jgi:hypothetical protein